MHRAARAVLAAVLLAALSGVAVSELRAAPAPAQTATIELGSPPAQSLQAQVTLGVPGLTTELRLRNTAQDAAGARSYRTGPTLVRNADGLSRPAAWNRLDGATGNTIAPGAELILQLSASLPEPGTYETWIDTFDTETPTQPDRRVHVTITRETASVPADFMVEPKPMHQVRWPWAREPRTILIELANTTPKPVEFLPPAILAFGMKSGDALTAAAAPLPTLDSSACVSPLAPGTRCALKLTVGSRLRPGEYAVDVGVAGQGGGFAQKTASLSVRLPLLAAVLVTALGVGGGWLVQAWRADGRRAVTALIDLGLLRDQVKGIVDEKPVFDLKGLQAPVLDTLTALERRARSGADVTADLTALSKSVDRLKVFARVERSFGGLPLEARTMLAAPHAPFVQQAAAAVAGQAAEGFDTLASGMAATINAWGSLAAAQTAARAQFALLQRLLALSADGEAQTAAAAARDALQTAMTAAAALLPADAGASAIGDRSATLQAATEQAKSAVGTAITRYVQLLQQRLDQRLQQPNLSEPDAAAARTAQEGLRTLAGPGNPASQIQRLEKLWPALASAPAATTAPPAKTDLGGPEGMGLPTGTPGVTTDPDLPVAIAFGLTPRRSPESLARQQRILEWATNLIILVAISLSGAVLVGSNASWGSPLDIINLLLTGLASRIVIGALSAATQPASAAH